MDVASGVRMSQSEEIEEEQSVELLGDPVEPSLASTWTVLSEDLHGLCVNDSEDQMHRVMTCKSREM